MHSHLDIELRNTPLVLPDDFSISIEERNPLFYNTEMFSYPVPIPLKGNRSIVKNIEDPAADIRPTQLEYEPVRIIADGMPFKSGIVKMTEGEDVRDSLTLNVDASAQSFEDLIGDLECQDVPLKDKIQVGEMIGNVKVKVKYKYKVKVHYHEDKKDEWDEFPFEDDANVSGIFEPQALGFSYPGICDVSGKSKQVAVLKDTRSYADGHSVRVPRVLQSFINVSEPYPEKPYCNARVSYLHHGLKDDGTTSEGLPELDKLDTSAREEHYPYWVLDADRPQSGLCFYMLYFLECLFTHLNVSYDLSALTEIEDFKHLCFFTTHHKFYTEVAHEGEEPERYEEGDNIPAGKHVGDIVTDAKGNPVMQGFFRGESDAQRKVYHGSGPWTTEQWEAVSEEDFNKDLFTDINTWLESRGCGGQFVLSYPDPKQVQDFDFVKNGVAEKIIVGRDSVQSITLEPTITHAKVSANIMSMYATSENFPEESVKTVLDSLENSFGIKFHYDYEQKKVTAYLLRQVFRDTTEPIDFRGKVEDMYKVTEKVTGIRMAYSAESDSKEQRKNVKKGVKDYDTDYDYIDYPEDKTVTDMNYLQIINLPKSQQKENLYTYIDRTTGNTYRWKTSADALESGEYKISLFQVATFKGVEIGDCRDINKDNIKEFISDFAPVPFSDVNYRITELMVQGDVEKSMTKDGNTYVVRNFNQNYDQLLSAYIDEDMEHEFVPQYINNALPSAFVDINLTERLCMVESYDPSQTDDGNSPLQHIDWGLAIAIMQGGGTSATVQNYDFDYDGFGNGKWRRLPGEYAMTSDSLDNLGRGFDYNGDREGDGGGERFSLKIRSWQQPSWADAPICNADEKDSQGHVVKKVLSRGLCDSFMSEYFRFLLERKMFKIPVIATVAELNNITANWRRRYRINGQVGWIGKVNYDLTKSEGIRKAVLEFYAL